MRKRQLVLAAVLFVGVVSDRSLQAATPGDVKSGSGTDGGACQVTSGANKGKTGTFSDGGTWCEGNWGGTECGTSKCKAAASGVHRFPTGQVTVIKGYLEASQPGASPEKMKAWEQKYHAKAIKKANGAVVITLPNQTLTFDSSAEKLATEFK